MSTGCSRSAATPASVSPQSALEEPVSAGCPRRRATAGRSVVGGATPARIAVWIALALVLTLASCSSVNPGSPGASTTASRPVSAAAPDHVTVAERAAASATALADAVTAEALSARLRELERLTLAADGNRGPGSTGYLAAASYVEDLLRTTGVYEVYRQPFTIQRPHPGQSRLVDGTGRVINQIPLSFSPGTPDAGIGGRLVAPTSGNGCRADDWGSEVRGQIGIVERGACPFTQLNQAAANAGALVLVVTNDREGGLYGTLDNTRPEYIPITGVTRSEGTLLRMQMDAGQVRLTFTFEQRIETFETFNVFAETRTGDPDNVVMAGAHLDSVPAGPGINDNGSGSMILLETALQLASRLAASDGPAGPGNSGPADPGSVNPGGTNPGQANPAQANSGQTPKVRFAWWSGEEWGLLGSLHWVNSMVSDDPQTIQHLAAYVNVDMVASPNFIIGVYDGDGSTFTRPDVPAGSAGLKGLFTSYFDRIGQPWTDVEFDDSSDYASFIPSGVPVGGLFTGAGEGKSAREAQLFGGVAGRSFDENYHQPADTFANISQHALEINGKATAHVVGWLVVDTSPVATGDAAARTPMRAEGFGWAGTL